MTRRLRASSILYEGYRNVASRSGGSWILGLVTLVATVGVIALSSSLLLVATDDLERARDGGANAFIVASDGGPAITAERCDQLLEVEGVRSAGAVLATRAATFESSPDDVISVQEVTPGYGRVAFPGASTHPGAAVGATAAKLTGARAGSALLERARSQPVVVAYAAGAGESRIPGAENSVLVPTLPGGTVTECVVEAEPANRAAVERLLLTWFAPGEYWSVLPMARSGAAEGVLDGRALIVFAPPAIALAVIALATSMHSSRRPEYALYRLLGWTRGQLLGMITWECSATVFAPAAAGVVLGLVIGSPLAIAPEYRQFLALGVITYLLVLLVVPPVIVGVVTRMSAIDALKGA